MTSDLALIAERRSGLAALLGLLLLEEPGPGLAELVTDVAVLAPLASGDPATATAYERVFLRGVPLYESVFRTDDGQHNGDVLATLVERYERLGFDEHVDGRWRIAGADHLGVQLRCYAQLCHDEAVAWRADTPDMAMAAVETERAFLANHTATWATVAVDAAIELACASPYEPLLEAVGDFLREEYDRLRPAPDLGTSIEPEPLPANVGPARLARLLLAPAVSGAWLSPSVVAAAARSIGVPWRPSDTRAALRHVIDAADDTDELAVVLAPILDSIRDAADRHRLAASQSPGNAANALLWAATAEAMLARLAQTAEAGLHPSGAEAPAETLVISGLDGGDLADEVDTIVEQLRRKGFVVDRVRRGG